MDAAGEVAAPETQQTLLIKLNTRTVEFVVYLSVHLETRSGEAGLAGGGKGVHLVEYGLDESEAAGGW